MILSIRVLYLAVAFAALFFPLQLRAQSKPTWQAEWEKTLEAAKREGKVAISIPASGAEMRKQLEENFKKRYGIEVEVFTARGSAAVRRMADEFKAGVHHFDLHIGGSSSAVSGMLDEGILDPIEPWMILPEVKDAKQWWGGHMWVDNARRYIYMFQAYLTESIWCNTDLVNVSGNLAIIKRPAHPNATKVFVNWLLGREGQEIVSKALGQATRRLDVDTKFLRNAGVIAAKDHVSVKEFWQVENQSEEKLDRVREPAQKFAQALLR